MLGSKDLGTNVFRTLMCNVGKPWSKQVLVLFRLAQSERALYVKLESSGCRSISDFQPGSIDRGLDSIDRFSGIIFFFFGRFFQLSSSLLKHRVLCFALSIKGKPEPRFWGCFICCMCESLVRSERWLPSHMLRIIKKEISLRAWWSFSCCNKSLKIHKQEFLYLLENPRKKKFVVLELSRGRVSKFSTGG